MHNTSEVLNTAADLIEERGWTTGNGWKDDGHSPLCLEGGIAAAAGLGFVDAWRCPAYLAVRAYLDTPVLFSWNDRLPYGRLLNPDSEEAGPWVGGSKEAAHKYARDRVIATLRAAALIEAAREEQDAAWSTYADAVTS